MPVKIHFLNVGAGDCTIIHLPERILYNKQTGSVIANLPERITMIDFKHHEDHDEYEHVIDYYKENFANKSIFRLINTHPHHDHIRGLHKLFEDSGIEVVNFWDVPHTFKPESFEGDDWHKDDWDTYQAIRDTSINTPKTLNYTKENERKPFWDEDNDNIFILSPTKELLDYGHYDSEGNERDAANIEIDDISYALMLKVNDVKVIFSGDGREKTWESIMGHSPDLVKNVTILKAPHHGVESAFHEASVKHINPTHVVFSNGYQEDVDHGSESLYSKHLPSANILKTSDHGTLIASIDYDGSVEFHDKYGNKII